MKIIPVPNNHAEKVQRVKRYSLQAFLTSMLDGCERSVICSIFIKMVKAPRSSVNRRLKERHFWIADHKKYPKTFTKN